MRDIEINSSGMKVLYFINQSLFYGFGFPLGWIIAGVLYWRDSEEYETYIDKHKFHILRISFFPKKIEYPYQKFMWCAGFILPVLNTLILIIILFS